MSFSEFYQRSINEPEAFWAEQARRIDWRQPFTQTLDHSRPPFARWFCGGTTNLCHNAVDRWLDKQPEALALIAVSSETDEERTFTFSQLHDEVNAVAAMLLSLGVQRGDRVLVYMPMIAEAQITLLACARIGAIHSVVFGGFASHSVAARIDDARPALIVSADAGARGGKILPYKKLLDDAIAQAQHQPKHVLLVDRGLAKMAWVDGRDLDFATLRQQHLGASVPVAWLESNETSCILYTSGTTGKPKGVQRDVGGYAVAAGADFIAPSAAMDGQVQAIRQALDAAGFTDTAIMSYSTKFASSFYGPFREAAGTALKGDRKTYQMNPMNRREAIRESLLDEAQGADCLMVKPAGAYLDVLREIRERTELPLGAYQVSGEYAMIKFAAMAGAIDEEKVVLESLGSIKRAGADLIFSYFALDLAEKNILR